MQARRPDEGGSAGRAMATPSALHEDFLTPTASPVTELRRRIEARGDELSFELHMAMEGVELLSHVRSRLACA